MRFLYSPSLFLPSYIFIAMPQANPLAQQKGAPKDLEIVVQFKLKGKVISQTAYARNADVLSLEKERQNYLEHDIREKLAPKAVTDVIKAFTTPKKKKHG